MSVANPWMLGSPAPVTSHWLDGAPGSAFSATISFCPIEMAKLRVAVCPPVAVTRATKFETPLPVGVPEITPVDGLRDSPAGRVPLASDQV